MTATNPHTQTGAPQFFQFEADFVDSLRCIPMQVRFKLDTCGIKLKLPHWHQFSATDRQELVEKPCETAEDIKAYRELLCDLIERHSNEPAKELPIDPNPAWMDVTTIPASVQDKAQEHAIDLTVADWGRLTPLQRFALIKLSRSNHENKNFYPALQEFGIATSECE